MARTIEFLDFLIGVTPYEHEANNYNALSIVVAFRRGRGFVCTWQPVRNTQTGYITGPIPSSDPLVGGRAFVVKEASRNSAKVLETMKAALLLGAEGIKFFFDQRNYAGLKEFMGDVCNYGYTADAERRLQETIARHNAKPADQPAPAQDDSPMMKQFRDLKSKHSDAVLLFRCGDFYEAYEDDAKACADVLGITLTKTTKTGIRMAGFPHHALDTYLPKLIHAGKRVAICDQLEDPKLTKKLVKRGITELANPATTNSVNNPQTTETMKLSINKNNESANVADAQVKNNAMAPAIEDATFEEVKDEQPAQEAPASSALPKVSFGTYTTKRGDKAPQIIGFGGEEDPRWKSHRDAGHKYVSASFRRDLNGEKIYILLFGCRYMDVAKALCGAYNTNDVDVWRRAEDACMAIYEQAQRDGKARWEEKKAAWKQKAEEKKAQKAADEQAKKCYTKEDVAAMLADVLAGKDVPEEIKALLAA